MGRRLSSGEMMRGVFIKHISPDSPAAHNGTLRTGDRILEVCVCGFGPVSVCIAESEKEIRLLDIAENKSVHVCVCVAGRLKRGEK